MRLIDADLFLDHLYRLDNENDFRHKIIEAFADIVEMTAQKLEVKVPQWVPCSEGMPEEDHWLGGSGKQFSDNVLVSIYNSDDEDEWVDVSQTIDGRWALELPAHCEITAWRELPEPYREEE